MLIDAFGQDLSALGIEDAGVVEVFADVYANDEVIGHGCVPPSDELEVGLFELHRWGCRTYLVLASTLL